jgi:hypothetical protein
MSRTGVSKALRDVCEWKGARWREVAHLPLEQAIAKRLRYATATAKRPGFLPETEDQQRVCHIAEAPCEYRVTKRWKA